MTHSGALLLSMAVTVDRRWTDAFGRCCTRHHDISGDTCTDQEKQHPVTRAGSRGHDR